MGTGEARVEWEAHCEAVWVGGKKRGRAAHPQSLHTHRNSGIPKQEQQQQRGAGQAATTGAPRRGATGRGRGCRGRRRSLPDARSGTGHFSAALARRVALGCVFYLYAGRVQCFAWLCHYTFIRIECGIYLNCFCMLYVVRWSYFYLVCKYELCYCVLILLVCGTKLLERLLFILYIYIGTIQHLIELCVPCSYVCTCYYIFIYLVCTALVYLNYFYLCYI